MDAFVSNASEGNGRSSADAIETIASTYVDESGAFIERALPRNDNSATSHSSLLTLHSSLLTSHFSLLTIHSSPDTGIYNALNKGVRDAKGEWFYVLGCDDYIAKHDVMDQLIEQADVAVDVIATPVPVVGEEKPRAQLLIIHYSSPPPPVVRRPPAHLTNYSFLITHFSFLPPPPFTSDNESVTILAMNSVNHVVTSFLRALVVRMKELGVTQTALAKRMNVSRPYVVKILHGDVNISFGTAMKFARALGLDFVPGLAPRKKSANDLCSWKCVTRRNVRSIFVHCLSYFVLIM